MSFKIFTWLHITILFFSFCHSSCQNNNKFEIGDQIEITETFTSLDMRLTFQPNMRVTVVNITKRCNLMVIGNGFNWNDNDKIRIDKANFNKIRKVKPFKVGQLIQALLPFESSNKYPRKIMRGEIMTIIKITANGSLVVFNRNWRAMKTKEKIADINFKHIKIIRDEFKKGQTIEALKDFETSSDPPMTIKQGEIMRINDIHEDGHLVVYNKKWGNNYEEWIEIDDFDKVKLSPTKVSSSKDKKKYCEPNSVNLNDGLNGLKHGERTHNNKKKVERGTNSETNKNKVIWYDLTEEENENVQVNEDFVLNENQTLSEEEDPIDLLISNTVDEVTTVFSDKYNQNADILKIQEATNENVERNNQSIGAQKLEEKMSNQSTKVVEDMKTSKDTKRKRKDYITKN